MTKSAIILAGGLGTRLRTVIQEIPKPMAPVNGQPFLTYVFDYLISYGIEQVVLSVGYKYEVILEHYGYQYNQLKLTYSVEHQRLGTGGAIFRASKMIEEPTFFALNGDSLFKVDLHQLYQFSIDKQAEVTLALKEMRDFDRYGIVATNAQQRVLAFKEKQAAAHGFINGGVYLLHQKAFQIATFPTAFSFEKDFLEKYTQELNLYACALEGYFIDIGIPTDYAKAQKDLVL